MEEYPDNLLKKRRESFRREIKVYNFFGISWGCFRNILIVIFLIILILLFFYFWSQGIYVGI